MKVRKCSPYRCTLFNCNKSLNKWTCCEYCGKKNECENRCQNDRKKCGYYKEILDVYMKI